jgi:Kef-type K+ transport system membrane component KefB
MSVTRRPKFIAAIFAIVIVIAFVILLTSSQSGHVNPIFTVLMFIGVGMMIIAIALIYLRARSVAQQ